MFAVAILGLTLRHSVVGFEVVVGAVDGGDVGGDEDEEKNENCDPGDHECGPLRSARYGLDATLKARVWGVASHSRSRPAGCGPARGFAEEGNRVDRRARVAPSSGIVCTVLGQQVRQLHA
jgi:hypothetical protein